MSTAELYEQDRHAWALRNAELLRRRRLAEVDLEHIAEELESMGGSTRRELLSRLEELLVHLLKWRYQPERREYSHSWEISIDKQRSALADLLDESPSLHGRLDAAVAKAYPRARRQATKATRLPSATFPETCPFTLEQLLDPDFWPE
jgi:hypothetical protein